MPVAQSGHAMGSPARPDDLTGWKQIASHLGRSVRSVQRWERELGLPVRRVRTQTSEVVFARRDEIAAWLAARSGNGLPKDDENGFSVPEPSPARRARRAWIAAGALVAAVALALAGRALLARRTGEPARWGVENGLLVVRDVRGDFLWAHRFDRPLDATATEGSRLGVSLVSLSDLDGDGTTEVLAALVGGLTCFEGDGRVRFRHAVHRSLRYGDESYGPEFTTLPPVVVPRQGGASIWVASVSTYFPAVVQRLDTRGRVLGEYWMAGHPATLQALEVAGRRVIAVGGTANESYRATLSILDPEKPTGTAPATVDKYRCRDCPEGHALAFLSFPRDDLSRTAAERPAVVTVLPSADGLKVVVATASAAAESRGLCGGDVHYTLDTRLRPVKADFGDAYAVCHAGLRARGLLDHDLGPRDEAGLFPVQAWYGGVEEQVEAAEPPQPDARPGSSPRAK